MFLTAQDLADWTECKRTRDQIDWLRERHIPFDIGAKGRPKVLRAVLEARLGAVVSGEQSTEPKWEALRGTP